MPAIKKLFCISYLLVFIGCINPHENFKGILHSQIGQKWDEMPYYQIPSEEELISSRILPNGNMEKKYKTLRGWRHNRVCIQIYEIDPKTDIIVDVGFEGSEADCVWNP